MTATTFARAATPARKAKHRRRDTRLALAMLAPALVLLGVFVIWPMIQAVQLSLYNWSFYTSSVFVGLRNFVNVLGDSDFIESVGRGLLFALMVVPTQLVIAFIFAALVKSIGRRVGTLLKISIYIPTVISGVIASIVFALIYQYSGGILNWFISLFGMKPVAWIGEVHTALAAVAVPVVWIGLGIMALIMLAGMLDIPESYYEAAALDGAGPLQRTIRITLPLMKNTILYLLVTGFVGALQQYEIPLVLTNGGPLNSTTLPNFFIFSHFRNDVYVGYSIAASLLLFVVLGSISAIVFKLLNSEKAVDA